MKKSMGFLTLFLVTALLLGGCGMQTVEQMYRVPRRSQSFDHVQKAMDMAMVGLEYAAPVSGENQQTVQLADLDGDGADEYILFARNPSQVPLNVLIFDTDEDGSCYLMDVMELQGSAFQKVEYVEINGKPGLEMVVGRQLSDRLQGSVTVYSFSSGRGQKLLSVGYAHFLTTDLNRDGSSELFVIQGGEYGQTGDGRAVASAYSFANGEMERSMEVRLSAPAGSVERILEGRLQDGAPAVFISSAVGEASIATDVLCMDKSGLKAVVNMDSSVMALRNYYVYAIDIDGDGVTEIPSLIPMQSLDAYGGPQTRYLICWYSMDSRGKRQDKIYTFHDYGGGWYLQLDPSWATRISTVKEGSDYVFYLWDEEYTKAEEFFTLFILTDSDRDQAAASDQRFPLLRKEGVAYAAQLHDLAQRCGVTEDYLKNSFHLIRQDWKTGET